jgi:hypothetical protein
MRTAAFLGAILLSLASAPANDALDVLEGKKKAMDIPLPPAPEENTGGGESREPVVYIEPQWSPSPLDPVWSRAILFEDAGNPWIQQVAVTGFFEWQAAYGADAKVEKTESLPEKDVDLDGSLTRRARLGARLRAFRNTDIEANAEFAGNGDYRGVERLSAITEITPGTSVKYGKFRPAFTTEYATEDALLPYPDRSMLVNMLAPASTLGLMIGSRTGGWDCGAGWFSGDSNQNIPGFEGNGFLAFNLSRTFVEPSGQSVMRTRWHLDYIHNLDGSNSKAMPRYNVAGRTSTNGDQPVTRNPVFRSLFSTGLTIDRDDFSFTGDFMLANGETSAWGMTLGPSYWLLPGTLKLVGRYHYAATDDAGSLVATMGASADPAFQDSPFFIGDEYQSFYLGANLHLYQDQMILMGGFEQIILNDELGGKFNTDASMWHTGARLSF